MTCLQLRVHEIRFNIAKPSFLTILQALVLSTLLCLGTAVQAQGGETENGPRVAIIGHLYSLLVEEHSHDAKPFRVEAQLDALISEIGELDVDAVFLLGDVTNNATAAEWTAVREAFARQPAPLYAVPGNHDMGKGLEAFLALGGQGNRSVVVGDTKFILLGHESFPNRPESPELAEFIAAELEDHTDYREVIVMMHFLRRGHPYWEQEIVPLLKGRVSRVFTGDLVFQHMKARTDPASGIRYISSSIRFKGEGAPVFLLMEQTSDGSRVIPKAVPVDLSTQWYEDPKELETSRDRLARVAKRIPTKVIVAALVLGLITAVLSLIGLFSVWRKFRPAR
ncbi:MAG: metallophosphoesterase [Gammaproteobacteria bacterium]